MDTQNIKQNLFYAVIIIIIFTIFCILGYIIKKQSDIITALQQNSEEQRQLKDNIVTVKSTLLTKEELDKKLAAINMDLGVIKDDLKKTKSDITGLITISAKTPGGTYVGVPNTGFYPRQPDTTQPGTTGTVPPDPVCQNSNNETCITDKHGYLSKIPYLKLDEPTLNDKIPFGEVAFDVKKEAPWSYKIHPREYSTSVIIATDPVGRKSAYAKMMIKPDDGSNKVYALPQTQIQYYEQYPEAQFYWWNPRIMFGANVGYSTMPGLSYGASAQVFTSTYGKFKYKPDWYIAGLGVGYDINNKAYNISVSPFMYKVTGDNSMFQNINVGPTISVDFKGNVALLGGIMLAL